MNNVIQRQLTQKISKSAPAELGNLAIRLRFIKHVKVASIKVKKEPKELWCEKAIDFYPANEVFGLSN